MANLQEMLGVCCADGGGHRRTQDGCNSLPDDCSETCSEICPGPPGRLSALSVFLSRSGFYGAFAWARRALDRPNRRRPARAVMSFYASCPDIAADIPGAAEFNDRCAAAGPAGPPPAPPPPPLIPMLPELGLVSDGQCADNADWISEHGHARWYFSPYFTIQNGY